MSIFETYLTLGFEHISDLNGYDHIIFIIALCAAYQLQHWRRLLVLVSAFTVGHSMTLALSTLGVILVPTRVIEFLIPVTIFLTGLFNVTRKPEHLTNPNIRLHYLSANRMGGVGGHTLHLHYSLALFFGLIHGMGFSNYLRLLLGKQESIIKPLLAFNVGLELGQLVIVVLVLGGSYLALNLLKIKHREWNLFLSGAAAGISIILMAQAKFW